MTNEQNPVKAKETAQEAIPAISDQIVREEVWIDGLAREIVDELTFIPGFDQYFARLLEIKDIIRRHLNGKP
jgi:hypothetical protein